MQLFRIHVRPQGGSPDMQTTFDFCPKHGLLGVGWRTPSGNITKNWAINFQEDSTLCNNLQVCAYIPERVRTSAAKTLGSVSHRLSRGNSNLLDPVQDWASRLWSQPLTSPTT
jgi:hypothetical protein